MGSHLLNRGSLAEATGRPNLAARIERLPYGSRPHPILAALASGVVTLRLSAGEALVRVGLRLQGVHRTRPTPALPAVLDTPGSAR